MHPALNIAVKAALRAGKIINRASNDLDLIKVELKQANEFVTEVDRKAEAAIIETLRDAYPAYGILAEESGATAAKGSSELDYRWIIDPLDGTTNFAHGFPFYSVSIGLEYNGESILGVVLDPVRGELFTSIAGQGAYLNGARLHVSSIDSLERALLVTGFAYNIRETPNNNLDHFSRLSLRAQAIRRTGSAALDLCYVASGRFDGYWEVKLSPWDMAAGIVLVREAGGIVSGFSRAHFSLYGQELAATNGRIHDQLLDAIHQRGSNH